ncbi:MAG: Bug family tripartite tricarboxylate transporter substrate binding protein [Burkholderiales bacterium]
MCKGTVWALLFAVLASAATLSVATAQSDSYPQRPIRLIVGFTPGGATDLVGRLVAEKLSERLGQQVVVDNRAGASGIIAARLVGSSQPDGYMLLISGSSISIVGSLYTNANFDVQRDLQPLALVATSPYVMVTHPSTGVKTVPELIAYTKPRAGKISYGASTPGTVQHLSTEMFKRLVGVDMLFVPYKGTGSMMPDILGGRIQVAVDNILVLTPHIRSAALQALAVTTIKRSPILPDVPSLAESGIPALSTFDTGGWFSMYTALRTTPAIVKKLNAEIFAMMKMPDVRERLLAFGATPLPGTPEELSQQLAREIPRWRKVIQDAGVKVE